MSDLAKRIEDRLTMIHFDGEGCGTYGTNACSNCHGPSPMSAYEIARGLAEMLGEPEATGRKPHPNTMIGRR